MKLGGAQCRNHIAGCLSFLATSSFAATRSDCRLEIDDLGQFKSQKGLEVLF